MSNKNRVVTFKLRTFQRLKEESISMIQRKKRVRHFQSPTHISDRVRKKIKKQESLTREREREKQSICSERV